MGKVVDLVEYRRRVVPESRLTEEEAQKKHLARALVEQAVLLLTELGEAERHVGWLLEDCAALLEDDPEMTLTR
jgi:hypothetical protein